jgi:hypothetical protein
MALITDYATLDAAVDGYLARDDLSTFVPNFIQNAEQTLYRSLRIRAMEQALDVTISSGVAALPTNPVFVELKYAYVNTSPVTSLDKVPPDAVYAQYPNRGGGAEIPKIISVERTNFIFGPAPGDYQIKGVYYARLTALSATNTTNWFTSYAPDLLLYGALLEAEPFLMNDPRIPVWQTFYQRAFASVQGEETRQRYYSGGSIATILG